MSDLPLLAALAGLAAATIAGADEPGAWQSHQLQFYYLSSSVAYSCEGLETELQELLEHSGAQQIIVTPAGPCNGAGRTVIAQLKFSTLKQTRSGTVPGVWHRVTISPGNLLQQRGNCELVQQFRNRILPLFDTRNVSATLNCLPFQATGDLFSLSFEVFAAGKAKLSGRPDVP